MCSHVCGPPGKPPPPNFTRYHDITYVVHTNVFVRYFCRFIRTWDRHDRDPAEASRTHRFSKHVAHSVCGGLHLVRPWGPRGGLPEPTRPLHHRRARAGQDHHTNRARAMRGHVGSERGSQTETVVVTDQSCRLYCCNGRDEKHCRGCDGPLGRGFRHKRFVHVPSSF